MRYNCEKSVEQAIKIVCWCMGWGLLIVFNPSAFAQQSAKPPLKELLSTPVDHASLNKNLFLNSQISITHQLAKRRREAKAGEIYLICANRDSSQYRPLHGANRPIYKDNSVVHLQHKFIVVDYFWLGGLTFLLLFLGIKFPLFKNIDKP